MMYLESAIHWPITHMCMSVRMVNSGVHVSGRGAQIQVGRARARARLG